MHESERIDETTGDQTKPKIVTFYEETKTGVARVDRRQYSVARVSC